MTPRQARTVPTALVLHPGSLREEWCPDCRAFTQITADLLLMSPDGVSTAGAVSFCEVCEDPDSPLPPPRIPRG
ncbi:hypothetical protein ACFPN0_15210 [Kitasatospora cinereorecta]